MSWIELLGKITQLYLSEVIDLEEFILLSELIREKIDNEKNIPI